MLQVVAALIRRQGRILICQRGARKARALLWEFAGGKVEPGETRKKALIRECREELGVAISVQDLYLELTYAYPDITIHLTVFCAEIPEGVPQKLEHHAIRWVTAEQLKNYVFCPADQPIVERILSEKL